MFYNTHAVICTDSQDNNLAVKAVEFLCTCTVVQQGGIGELRANLKGTPLQVSVLQPSITFDVFCYFLGALSLSATEIKQ